MPRYTLETDDRIVWQNSRYPTQREIDATCVAITEQGWNGTVFDLLCDGTFRKRVFPSEAALSGALTVREIWEAENYERARQFGEE